MGALKARSKIGLPKDHINIHMIHRWLNLNQDGYHVA